MKKIIVFFINFISTNLKRTRNALKYFPECFLSEVAMKNLPVGYYDFQEFSDLKAQKKSDTIYIFGSGGSISDITPEEWSIIRKHNTLSFNNFFVQKYIDIDYHIVREIGDVDFDGYERESLHQNIAHVINQNKFYDKTIFCFQKEWQAWAAKFFVGSKILKEKTKVFPFYNKFRGNYPPSERIEDGLTHGPGTLSDCINLAYLLGFKKIVLCGVDLNDRRYFWMKPGVDFYDVEGLTIAGGETSTDAPATSEVHRTANGLFPFIESWNKHFLENGVHIYIQNPRSLLNEILPVYDIVENVSE